MSKAAFYYFLPVFIGAIFLVVGLWLVRRVARNTDGAPGRMGCLGFALMVGGGVIALAAMIAQPTPWERQRRVDAVLHTTPEQIKRIVITPGRAGTYKPLVKSPVVIDDAATLARVADILHAAKPTAPDEPSAIWTAQVHLMTDKEVFAFTVSPTYDGRNGTILSVSSNSDGSGWNLGDFRADGMEKILQDAATAAGKRRAN